MHTYYYDPAYGYSDLPARCGCLIVLPKNHSEHVWIWPRIQEEYSVELNKARVDLTINVLDCAKSRLTMRSRCSAQQ